MLITKLVQCMLLVFLIGVTAFLNIGLQANSFDSLDGLTQLVSRKYENYAWITVYSNTPPPDAVPFAKADLIELKGFFTTELAHALWNDAQCSKKIQEICLLDFDILFDSQDPHATDLSVNRGEYGLSAKVCFKDLSETIHCLIFVGEDVSGVIKVKDILYPEGLSLRQILKLN